MRHDARRHVPALVLVLTGAVGLNLPGCYVTGRGMESAGADDTASEGRQTGRFGYAALGYTPYSHFFGNVKGLSSGVGATIYFPPMVPVQTVAAAVVVAVAVAPIAAALSEDEPVDPEVLSDTIELLADATEVLPDIMSPEAAKSGFEGALSELTHDVISDFSFDLAVNFSRHDDELYGGGLDYIGLLLGVRLAGARRHLPRYYVCGGLGWYWFDFENRPNASVPGPYAGVGAELFTPGDRFALGIEYRANFYFGEDASGEPMDGGQGQLSALFAFYW